LIALIIDILILSNYSFHWFPAFVFQNKVQTGRMIFYISGGLVSLALIGGYINSINPVVNRIQLKLGKSLNFKNYTIAVFSDTHLGFIVRKSQLEKIVELTNKQNPDIIFIIGDLSDEPASNIEWAVEPLKRLKASDGVWMVTGNHEFYHGLQGISDLVQRANVNLLRNQAREIEGKINIVGLDDVTGGRQFRQEMPAIVDLVQGLNHNLPTILLHHTPVRRQEAEQAGVDLMLSGHTHAGQLWPFGELAKATYKIVPGLSKIGNMYFYLSVGAGTWGPPIRLGSRSEVVKVVIIN
jgi:predicted MPP superfamily phosphohydrolase